MERKFRIDAQHYFFTYPQVDESLTHDDVGNFMLNFDPTGVVVAREHHRDGGIHYHVYVKFPKRFNLQNNRLFDIKGFHPNIQSCRSPKHVLEYVLKDGNYKCYGDTQFINEFKSKVQTKRRIAERLIKGETTLTQEVSEAPNLLFGYSNLRRDLASYQLDLMRPSSGLRRNLWIWGSSGVGKTRLARSQNEEFHIKSANKWWDGYRGQKLVILDDLDVTHTFLGYFLKIWADRYECYGETKGGHIPLIHESFIVTSQYSIQSIFTDQPTIDALKRRFRVIHLISYDGVALKFR